MVNPSLAENRRCDRSVHYEVNKYMGMAAYFRGEGRGGTGVISKV